MSDGPEKTLKMRKGWQEVAKCARLDAYDVDEVSRKISEALKQDWNAEISSELVVSLREILGDGRQGLLLDDQRLDRLERLLPTVIGTSFGAVLVQCAMQVLSAGFDGPLALQEAVKRSLIDRALCGSRQVEGHFLAESGEAGSTSVRQRLDAARDACEFEHLAKRLFGEDRTSPETPPPKRAGLDEGPRLRPAPP
jgi:hypothetical protein